MKTDAPKFKISVVICTYNRAPILIQSIVSLDNQEGVNSGDYEIIIIDDGSGDDTAMRVKELETQTSLRYFFKDWGGRSEARNMGIEKAQGEIIVFVDDDIIAPPRFLTCHLEKYCGTNKIVVRGPIVNVREPEIIPDFKPGPEYYSSAFFCTCNASTHKKTLEEIGGFDTDFKEYGFEDNEIGWRLRQAGCEYIFSMDAYIFHYKPHQRETLEKMKKRAEEMGRSAFIYHSKHNHWKVKMAVGLHPLNYYFSRLLNNKYMANWGEKLIKSGKLDKTPFLQEFFLGRIYHHSYLSSLLDASKKED